MTKETDLDYSVKDLDSIESSLWKKFVISNVEMLAKNLGIKSVEKRETLVDGIWTVKFYLVRKNDSSVDLVKYNESIIFNGKEITPKSLDKSYIFTLNIWDTLIVTDWKRKYREILDCKENFLQTKIVGANGTSNINYEKILSYLMTWKLEIKKGFK